MIESHHILDFQKMILDYYSTHARPFAWRYVEDPYHVVVSEIMLQQTQTQRIAQRYPEFVIRFPTFESLANATTKEVLSAWQGLGYNRRGLYLHRIAQKVVFEYCGQLPADPLILEEFPGIGPATARSICAFAFNMPTVFIETNIRSVFIHHFFPGKSDVHDREVMPLVQASLDHKNPREWYYALMDYGVMLKKMLPNPSRKSVHHAKQSKFEGSDRQIRGAIIRLLTKSEYPLSRHKLYEMLAQDTKRVDLIIDQMLKEHIVTLRDGLICI